MGLNFPSDFTQLHRLEEGKNDEQPPHLFPLRHNGNLTDSPWGLMYHLLGRNKLPPALKWKETQYEVLCLSLPHKGPFYYAEVGILVLREQEAKMTDVKGYVQNYGTVSIPGSSTAGAFSEICLPT